METQQIVDSILKAVRNEVTDFVESHENIKSSIAYEERLIEVGQKLALELLRQSSGQLAKSRNSKKKS